MAMLLWIANAFRASVAADVPRQQGTAEPAKTLFQAIKWRFCRQKSRLP
jgi:hypothetical protein